MTKTSEGGSGVRAALRFLRRRWGWVVLAALVVGAPLELEATKGVFCGTAYLSRAISNSYLDRSDRKVRLYLWLHLPLNGSEPLPPKKLDAVAGKRVYEWWDPSGSKSTSGWFDHDPLAAAIWHKRPDLLALLLHRGANPNRRTEEGFLPLQMAAAFGEETMVEALLNAGAQVNAVDDGGCTALDAARRSSGAILGMLLDKDARLNVNRMVSGPFDVKLSTKKEALDSCLLGASSLASPSGVETLLERGADPNAKGSAGATPLLCLGAPFERWYWGSNDVETCAGLLIAKGANPNVVAQGGHCREACPPGREWYEEPSLTAGWTPLHYAAQAGNVRFASLLLKAGANPNAKDGAGLTPLDCVSNGEGWR